MSKKYNIYFVVDGRERLLTVADLKEVPVTRKHHTSLYNLLEGIRIGVTFADEKYRTLEFKYEEC